MGVVGEANRLWTMIGPERRSTRSPVPRSCRGLVWHVGRTCKTGLGGRRLVEGVGLGRGFRAWLWLSLTLARLCPYCFACWCYFVYHGDTQCARGSGLTRRGRPRVCGVPLCRPLSGLWPAAWSAPRPHELPSFLVPRVRLLAHRVVLLCHANWISTTSFAGYSRIAALYRFTYGSLTYLRYTLEQ